MSIRRPSIVAITALSLVALVGTSVSARPAPSFHARAGVGEVGGSMLVKAKVKHREKGVAFSATADVTFPSGAFLDDVALTRKGRSYVAATRVAVAETELPGVATVVVTIAYGDAMMVLDPVEGSIVPAEADDLDP